MTDRRQAEEDRDDAALDRARAAEDRSRASDDRTRAREDRARAADDRAQAQADLRHAHLDELTGVATRAHGFVGLEAEVDRAHRTGLPLALAFVDVDKLKQINDQHGHAAGDKVLRAVGTELASRVRSYDLVVRAGGDEFLCALSDMDLEGAQARMDDVRESLLPGASISFGVAQLRPAETFAELSGRGDAALYRAKQAR